MYATYFIPRENEAGFTAKLDKLAKRAVKLGLAAITYIVVKTFPLERTRYRAVETPHGTDLRPYKVTVEHVAYTVEGGAPTLAGWEFLGTIQHEGGVNILRTIADAVVPSRFRDASPDDCDHCNKTRNRTDTYIVRHVETGEFKQVGRSCLKDFLGNKSPAEIAAYCTALLDFLGDAGGEEREPGSRYVETYDLVEFLAVTAAAIKEYGWTSRSKAREYNTSATADDAMHHLTAQFNPALSPEARKASVIPGADHPANAKLAEAAIEWAKRLDSTDNDYIHNIQAIAELGYVTHRTAGYAASIVSGYFRETDKALRKEVLGANGTEHVGTIGKREELLLTLIAVFYSEGYYGTTAIHKFADSAGNAVTWFASNEEIVPCSPAHPGIFPSSDGRDDYEDTDENHKGSMVKGATYRLKATVKSHDHYKGQAQTVVSRVAYLPIAAKPKAKRARKAKKAQPATVDG